MHYTTFSAEPDVKLEFSSPDAALFKISCTLSTRVEKEIGCPAVQRGLVWLFHFFKNIFHARSWPLLQQLCILWPLLSPSVLSERLLPLHLADDTVFVCQSVIDRHPPALALELEEVFFLSTGTLRERVRAAEWGGWIATSRELDWLSASAPRWTDAAVKQASAPLSNAPCFASQSAPLLHSGSSQRNQRLRKCFIYMLVFDGFLLTQRGAAAIYLCTFKATKLRITVNNTAQTCLKRQLSHFPGGESPAGYGCCFCQELHILWSRLNKKHCSS